MCMFGSPYREYVSLLAPSSTADLLTHLDELQCPRSGGHASHISACGLSDRGVPCSSDRPGHHHPSFSDFLLQILSSNELSQKASLSHSPQPSHTTFKPATSEAPNLRQPITETTTAAISVCPILDERTNAAVERARHEPAGFSSLRYLRHADADELMRSPLPDIHAMARELAESSSSDETSSSRPPRLQWDGAGDWRTLVRGAPIGTIRLADLIPSGIIASWLEYMKRTQLAFDALREGRPHHSPGDFVVRCDVLPAWAQPFIWDTENPEDCRPVQRSTRHTEIPGSKQFDRSRIREMAEALNWNDVDPDIVAQAGEGGFELRSCAPLHTTAVWHHSGVISDFSTADEVVQLERQNEWTRVSRSPLPFIPSVFSPRDVIWQERSKLNKDGQLELFMKPRVTHDMSAVPRQLGGRKAAPSVNSSIPKSSKSLPGLPKVQSYARAQAICSLAGSASPSEAAGVYGVDEAKAYSFGMVQLADLYSGCYLWPDTDGTVRPHVSLRMVFGGGSWPNRFERLSLMACAWIQSCQRAFDSAHPYPEPAMRWIERRRALQLEGQLPTGEAQIWPAGVEPYIDDFTGRALTDTVPVPAHLRHIPIGSENTAAIGARPAATDSRLAVHCRIAIDELRKMGAEVPDDKTMCGSGMVALGVQMDASAQCIRCPELKRAWLRHAVQSISRDLTSSSAVSVKMITRFTGRLTNLSQFFPELRRPLAVGYALSRVRWRIAKNGTKWPLETLKLHPGRRRARELLELLDVVSEVIREDVGVSMAPPLVFESWDTHGVITVVTDASRADHDDGLGGYAFSTSEPHTVFVMSEAWHPGVKAALDAAAVRRSLRAPWSDSAASTPRLSMPAAETFASVSLAVATAAHLHLDVRAVVVVGDCGPAAKALSSLHSSSSQLRQILRGASGLTSRWLGVSVPREMNPTADILSHPSRADEAIRSLLGLGLRIQRVSVPPELWELALAASLLPLGSEERDRSLEPLSTTILPFSTSSTACPAHDVQICAPARGSRQLSLHGRPIKLPDSSAPHQGDTRDPPHVPRRPSHHILDVCPRAVLTHHPHSSRHGRAQPGAQSSIPSSSLDVQPSPVTAPTRNVGSRPVNEPSQQAASAALIRAQQPEPHPPVFMHSSRQLSLYGRRVATVNRLGHDGSSLLPPAGVCMTRPPQQQMAPPPPRAPSARTLAGSLDLLGPIGGGERAGDQWSSTPAPSERSVIASLRTGADIRVSQLTDERSSTHLTTALNWFSRFMSTLPSRVPFKPYTSSSDIHAAAYNEETFRLFAEFVRQHGSIRPGFSGVVVSSTAISDYISALRAFLSRETGYDLRLPGGNLRLRCQLQQMRREDGPTGQRALSRGLTARILRKLKDTQGFTSEMRGHSLRWAVLWVGHNLMARGGELGVTDRATFSPTTGLTIADADWLDPSEETAFYSAVVIEMMPIKDTHASRQRIPCPIRRCSLEPPHRLSTSAVSCTWEALRKYYLIRSKEVPVSEWAIAPLFSHPDGVPICTSDVKTFIRQAAEAAGEPRPEDFDARALRIGGATDLYHLFGGAEAERVIQKRGRWCSMIHDIYSRISATSMLATSAALHTADGVDLEAFRHGYVMPALVTRRSNRLSGR